MEERKKCIGFINPTGMVPAFVTPIYSSDTESFIALLDEKKRTIKSFFSFDSKRYKFYQCNKEIAVSIGDDAIFGFTFSEDVTVVGVRKKLCTFLRLKVNDLKSRPFLLAEVATFLEDEELQDLASRLIDNNNSQLELGNIYKEYIQDDRRSEEFYQKSNPSLPYNADSDILYFRRLRTKINKKRNLRG